MDSRSIGMLALAFVAVVWTWRIGGFAPIFVVALFATALTVGLWTGSLAPYYPTVTRGEAPKRFWLVMIICAVIVVANIMNLLWI